MKYTEVDITKLEELKRSIPLNRQVGNAYFHWQSTSSWVFVPSTKKGGSIL